jgi:hypothetical protein
VVAPLVDFALGLDGVDPERVAYTSWSLGGYLAPRAASGEHRLAACVADPGIWDFLPQVRGMVLRLGLPQEAAAALPRPTRTRCGASPRPPREVASCAGGSSSAGSGSAG